jgi:hypothetical protein
MKKPLLFMKDNYFTKDQRNQLLNIFDGNQKALLYFCSMIAPAIYYAGGKRGPTPHERELSRKVALKSANRLKDDLENSDIFWDLWVTDDGFKEWWIVISLISRLEKSLDQLPHGEKGYSRYEPLAAAVGKTMAECGLKVKSYYNDTFYDPPHMGNAAKVIEICIAAARLKPTNNLKQLAQIAKTAARNAKLTSN